MDSDRPHKRETRAAERAIADAFRVPPELIGLPRHSWPVRFWRWLTGCYR